MAKSSLDGQFTDPYNKTILNAKRDWEAANSSGNKAAADAAHAKAEAARAQASKSGVPTYTSDTHTINYAENYSPGENSWSRPPAWLDWDDDGALDNHVGGGQWADQNGNTFDKNHDNIADWHQGDNNWQYQGENGGGWEYTAPHNDIPHHDVPPPPQGPPGPGPAPDFTKETQKEVVRYEYLYGLKDLKIAGNVYAPKSIYVSKPIPVEGNVMQVSLTSIEEHPLFSELTGEAADRQTSVEYYIAYKENPSLEEWHPILPEDQSVVRGELLIFQTAHTANLRFAALVTSFPKPAVYKDGIKLPDKAWSFTAGGLTVQLTEPRSAGSIYTIDYTPNAEITDPWTLDIKQHGIVPVKFTEMFPNGTNHNKTIVLSKYPYIDYEKINGNVAGYTPLQVNLKNANIAGPNRTVLTQVDPSNGTNTIYTKNVTDYKTGEWKKPTPYNLTATNKYTVFEYWNEGNKIYFSETFNKSDVLSNQEINHGNAEIQVQYEYLVSHFRTKIILRRNGAAVNSVSPIVSEYALKFKVMK